MRFYLRTTSIVSVLLAISVASASAQAPAGWDWTLISAGSPPRPNDPASALPSIHAVSPTDVFLTGCVYCMFHWDGTSFSSPSLPAGANRYTVSGQPGGPVYSAGQQGYQSGNLMRFDGATWTTVLVSPVELFDAWVASDGGVFVVGDGLFYGDIGSGFASISTGLSSMFNTDRLLTVTGFSSNDVFLGGYHGRILRYDGTSVISTPTGTNAAIVGMDGSGADNLFAVGSAGTVLKFNGSGWDALPTIGTGNLRGVKVLGPDDVLVSGDNGLLARWNGATWTVIDMGTTANFGEISTPDNGATLFLAEVTSTDVRFRLGNAVYAPPVTVPEPAGIALVAMGMLGLTASTMRRLRNPNRESRMA